jgi:hypothetical protein
MPRFRLPLLLTLLALAVLPAAAHAQVRIGIGDQKPSTFSDPRFQALGIKDARFLIPWDLVQTRAEIKETDAWLQAARDAGVEPLISFTRSRRKGHGQDLPSVRHYVRDFKKVHRRWPWVRDFSIWNEANLCSRNPTCHAIGRVVRYYKAVRKACRRCRIMPAELLDMPNMAHWVETFEKKLGHAPQYWGLHNYRDANRLQQDTTKALLKATNAEIWITETGGIMRHGDEKSNYFPMTKRHAAKVTKWLFSLPWRMMPPVSVIQISAVVAFSSAFVVSFCRRLASR